MSGVSSQKKKSAELEQQARLQSEQETREASTPEQQAPSTARVTSKRSLRICLPVAPAGESVTTIAVHKGDVVAIRLRDGVADLSEYDEPRLSEVVGALKANGFQDTTTLPAGTAVVQLPAGPLPYQKQYVMRHPDHVRNENEFDGFYTIKKPGVVAKGERAVSVTLEIKAGRITTDDYEVAVSLHNDGFRLLNTNT